MGTKSYRKTLVPFETFAMKREAALIMLLYASEPPWLGECESGDRGSSVLSGDVVIQPAGREGQHPAPHAGNKRGHREQDDGP
jgi:hypothetical protein